MENDVNEVFESVTEDSSSSAEVTIESSESSENEEEVLESSNNSDRTDEVAEDLNYEDDEENVESESEDESETDTPSSTVIQVTENLETGDFDITELDVGSLNIMSESYVESMLSVVPTTNDYYDFLPNDVLSYFQGIMSNNLLNDYRAYHLRHYIYYGQYYSYYDDYYYLFYDYDGDDPEQCVELYKANGSNSYQVTWGTAEVLNATIMYGNEDSMSDFRKGVSYGEEMALLLVVAGVLVLYIVNAFFRHIRS